MTDQRFSELLGSGAYDHGCEATFEVLDRYVDAVVRRDDLATNHARVMTHLRNCAACGEDAAGLVAALQAIDPPPRATQERADPRC